MASSSLPFPVFKASGDEKSDIEVYVEDLIDYCTMNNWYDASKDTDEQKWTNKDKAMACLRASLPPAVRTVFKYSLGLDEADQKKPHRVIQALKEYYGASIGVAGERQKFLRLFQKENDSIGVWESQVRNQGAQCEYESFADEIMRDQFIAGLVSESLRVKLIGKGHRHRESPYAKVTLREVVEIAKVFEATTLTNQLMKTARGSQEQVNYNNRIKDQVKQANRDEEQKTPTQLCSWCLNNHRQPRQQHCPAYNKKCNNCSIFGGTKEESNRPIKSKRNRQKICLQQSIQNCNLK